jgi:hypothetical protein
MEKMSLRELLNYVDFDYEIIKNDGEDYTDEYERGIDLIRLIDLQDVYLGDIAEFRVRVDEKLAIDSIIDRLDIYWNDYVITGLEEDLDVDKYNDWNELYKLAKEKYGKDVDNNTILGYLLDSSNIYIEEITQGGKV